MKNYDFPYVLRKYQTFLEILIKRIKFKHHVLVGTVALTAIHRFFYIFFNKFINIFLNLYELLNLRYFVWIVFRKFQAFTKKKKNYIFYGVFFRRYVSFIFVVFCVTLKHGEKHRDWFYPAQSRLSFTTIYRCLPRINHYENLPYNIFILRVRLPTYNSGPPMVLSMPPPSVTIILTGADLPVHF